MKTASAVSALSIGCLPTAYVVSAFTGALSTPSKNIKQLFSLRVSSAETTSASTSTSQKELVHHSNNNNCWASHALLFSSLSDGVVPNTAARSFLKYSLANKLLREHIAKKEDMLETSVKFSPCNGPDVDALNNLESVDQIFERGRQFTLDDFTTGIEKVDSWTKEALKHIHMSADANCNLDVRVLYIPTATYALNPNSSNTPGKQRQRARADGKKRRTLLVKLIDELLSSIDNNKQQFNMLAITLDLDDGSLKQPTVEDTSAFPKNDKEALSSWHPHLVYFEGGNTFWLQHCIEKGDYFTLIKDACTGPDGAVYCGKSAGAIVAGSHVSTATWKGWDDPSVVPGKETYDDWLDCNGFGFAGNHSFFPHMSDDWQDVVEENVEAQNLGSNVYCLREENVCCVIGDKKLSFINSRSNPIK